MNAENRSVQVKIGVVSIMDGALIDASVSYRIGDFQPNCKFCFSVIVLAHKSDGVVECCGFRSVRNDKLVDALCSIGRVERYDQ